MQNRLSGNVGQSQSQPMKQILSTKSRFLRLVPLPLSNELGQGNHIPTNGHTCQASSSAVTGLEWETCTDLPPWGPWQTSSQGLQDRKKSGVGSVSASNTCATCFSTQPQFPQTWNTNSCPACILGSHQDIPAGRDFGN